MNSKVDLKYPAPDGQHTAASSSHSSFHKGAGASEAPGQTKEEFSANDTSRDPKVLKIGPQHG